MLLLVVVVICAQRLASTRLAVRAALLRLGDALAASGDAESIVRLLLDTVRTLTDAEHAHWWFDRGPSIERVMTSGHGRGPTRLERGEGVVGEAIDTDQVTSRHGALAIPVRVRNRMYGVLELERGRSFSSGEIADVTTLIGHATSAIERIRAGDEARRLSLTDGLTGLWNRRQFELRAAQELERATRFGERFSIVIVDLDGFKSVNDSHGHLVGDAVLVEASHRLVTFTREVDTVARYGGEEFVLLLPQTDLDGARKVAEKVRSELAGAPVETDVGPLTITMSAGVASHPRHGTSVDSLLRAADRALYAAKSAGKNRVVTADPHPTGIGPA